jgi:hypothetical protein
MIEILKQRELAHLEMRIANAPKEMERCLLRAEKYRDWEKAAAAQVAKLRSKGEAKKAASRESIRKGHERKVRYYSEQIQIVERDLGRCTAQLALLQKYDKRALPLVGVPIDDDWILWTRTNNKSEAASWAGDCACRLEKVNGFYWALFETLGGATLYVMQLPAHDVS